MIRLPPGNSNNSKTTMKRQAISLLICTTATSTISAFLPIIIQPIPRSPLTTVTRSITAVAGDVLLLQAKKPKSPESEPPSSSLPRNPFEAFLSPKEAEEEEAQPDQDKGFSFRGLFRRDKDDSGGNDKTKQARKQSSSSKRSLKKEKRQEKSKKTGLDKGAEEEKDSILSRVPLIFSKKDDDDKEESKSNDNSSNNPLGAIAQKVLSSSTSFITTLTQEEKQSSQEEQWITVFPKTRISPGELVPVTVAGLDLLVIASKDARRLYCIANSCPHLGTPLETGTLARLPTTTADPSSSDSSTGNSAASNSILTETDVANILQQDGCEDCIVCPLHRTAFALQSGQVRGEWCPYPPVIGKMMGTVKRPTAAAVFDIRTRGKNVQVRINSPLTEPNQKKKKKDFWE